VSQAIRRLVLDGGSRSDAAKVGGVTLQIVRDSVLRFNAQDPEDIAAFKKSSPPVWRKSEDACPKAPR